MSMTTIKRIQVAFDVAANWASVNPILGKGEIGVETDGSYPKYKLGDGVTNWSSLTKGFCPVGGPGSNQAFSIGTLTVGPDNTILQYRTDNTSASKYVLQAYRGNGTGTSGTIITTGNASNGVASIGFGIGTSLVIAATATGAIVTGTLSTGALTATSVVTTGDGRVGSATTVYNARFEVIKGAADAYVNVGDEFTAATANKNIALGTGGYRNVLTINGQTGSVAATRSTTGLLLNSFYSSNAYAAASLLVNCNTGNGTIHFYTGTGSVETPIERVMISSTGLTVAGGVLRLSQATNTTNLGDKLGRVEFHSSDSSTNAAKVYGSVNVVADANFDGVTTRGVYMAFHVGTLATPDVEYMRLSSTGLAVTGDVSATTLRINTAPSTSTATASTHKVAVNLNGTTYYLLATNA